jgi:hypothetical protein
MKTKKSRGNAKSSGQRATKDLSARRDQGVKGGRSDLGQQLQLALQEANNIYTRR